MPSFAELGVPPALTKVLDSHGITTPFPIQAATLPDALAGRDVLGRGRTGSGKTYAFVLPMLARLAASGQKRQPGRPRALVLAPTRELATQIHTAMRPLADALGLRTLTVFGGVGQHPQVTGLRRGVDVLVACPGRLADHVKQGNARLDAVEVTVLDEADHMADLGFLPEVKRLLDTTPRNSQRLLFSATLDSGVDVIVRRYLHDPVTHSVDTERSPVSSMSHHVLHVRQDDRLPVLVDLTSAPGRTLVFTRTKHGARKLAKQLAASGVPTVELHGNLAQNVRTRNLTAFHDGSVDTMVATDIAARGIHVDDISLVVHADPPVEHKAYLHRSGRTARAGADGTVITLMTDAQVRDVRDLTRKAGIRATTTKLRAGHALLAELAPGERRFVKSPVVSTPAASSNGGGYRNGRRGSSSRRRPETGGAPSYGQSRSQSRSKPRSRRPAVAAGAPRGAASFSSGVRTR